MQPPDGMSKTQFVVQHVQNDLQPKSGSHLTRNIVSGAMLVVGLGIVTVKYIMGVINNVPPVWGQNELILVLALIVGGFSILFTQTTLSILHIVWPFGKKQ